MRNPKKAFKVYDRENIEFKEGVTETGFMEFAGWKKLETVKLPDSLTKIGGKTFWQCESLKSIDIPKNVTEIGEMAFCRCISLRTVKIPKGVTKICDGTFAGCEKLKSVKIPEGVTEIESGAFSLCTSLQSLELPESLVSLGRAFYECNSLRSITIPKNVTKIDDDFAEFPNLIARVSKGSYADTFVKCKKEYYKSKSEINELYKQACAMKENPINAVDLQKAYGIFNELGDYKNCSELARESRIQFMTHKDIRIKQVAEYLKSEWGEDEAIIVACDDIQKENWVAVNEVKEKYLTQKSALEDKIPPLNKQLEDTQTEYNDIAKKLFAGKKKQALLEQIDDINKKISNVQEELKSLEYAQKKELKEVNVKTGTYFFPVRPFYEACEMQGIKSLKGDEFASIKAQQIMTTQFREIGVSEVIIGRYLKNVSVLFEMGQNEQKVKDKIPVKGRIEEEDMPAYNFNNTYNYTTSGSKTRKILSDKYNELNKEINKMREGEEAMKELSRMMYTAYSTTPKRDWAVAGGIASGLAGPAAGVAAAMDAMADNARIEQQNAANRAAAKERSMSMYKMSIDTQVSRMALERDRDRIQEELKALGNRIVITDHDKTELFAALKCVCTPAYIERKKESIVIIVGTQNNYNGGASSSHIAIDGVLQAKIYCDANTLIDTIPIVLPLKGIKCGASVDLIGVSQKHMNGHHSNYRVEIEPVNLWLTEV